MKRAIIITGWTIAFAVVALLISCVAFALLGQAGFETWPKSTVLAIGRTCSLIFFSVPLAGLILGLFGKLPGTKRS